MAASTLSEGDDDKAMSHSGVALSLHVATNRSPRPGHKRLNRSRSSSSSSSRSPSLKSLKTVSSMTGSSSSSSSSKKKKKLSAWLMAWPIPILPSRSRQNSMDDTATTSETSHAEAVAASEIISQSIISTRTIQLSLDDMPTDVLTHILGFAGPQAASRLAQTSRLFSMELGRDDDKSSVWNVLGQCYGKVGTVLYRT